MKKKILSIFLCSLAAFSLLTFAGCKKKPAEDISEVITEEFVMNYLILVNNENQIPANWEENVETVEYENVYGDKFKIEKETKDAFVALKNDLYDNDYIYIEAEDGGRTLTEQQDLYNSWVSFAGEDIAKEKIGLPNVSEAQTFLAVNICLDFDGLRVSDQDELLKNEDTFKKVHSKLAEHGFILRYPKGKENITGHSYAPWHFRYIGDTEIAKYIMDNNLTLEEYLQSE